MTKHKQNTMKNLTPVQIKKITKNGKTVWEDLIINGKDKFYNIEYAIKYCTAYGICEPEELKQ